MQLVYEINLLKKILRNHLHSEHLQWNYTSFNVKINRLTSISSIIKLPKYFVRGQSSFRSLKQSPIFISCTITEFCVTSSLALDILEQNKNALTAAISLNCLEIRSRNEEAINSTRNRVYSLKVFYSYFIDVDTFYLFLNWFSTRSSDDRKYDCSRRLYAKTQRPPFQRNYIIARDQKNDLYGTLFQSSPKINRMLITR